MTLPEKMRFFADLFDNAESLERPMTHEEYKFIKDFPVFDCIEEFWNKHLTSEGYKAYKNAASQGRHGKWNVYLNLWKHYNTPLARML